MNDIETKYCPSGKPVPEPARAQPMVPLLSYQREDVESPARFRWNCWSRQSGKSFTKSLRRILRALARRRNQIFLSAGERQSRELMEKARQHCQALKIACDYYDRDYFRELSIKQLEIKLPGGVRIIGLPANPQTSRGFTGDVLLDEFAMHAYDREIWSAMFPTVLRGNGELDVASTPKGRGNRFYQLRDNPQFSHSTLTLPDAIAQGLNVDAEQIRLAMGDDLLYRQEFLCEFLDESSSFLTYEQIAACVDPLLVLYETPAAMAGETGELFVGIDVGRLRDLTVMWVLAKEEATQASRRTSGHEGTKEGEVGTRGQRDEGTKGPSLPSLTTVAIFELAGAPFRVQDELIGELLSLRQVRRCCIDAGGLGMQLAERAVERFGDHRVEGVRFTPVLKSQLAGGLRIAVESRRIRIPADEHIRNDWHSLERMMTESGHFRLAAPRREGSHADRFWAAALAVYAANEAMGIAQCANVRRLQYVRTGTW